ncbi:uncharacterized protein LOC132549705 [Ylistrum balloti]|uniref:uncharacterized protein LOC132549705 n=1 Tax=Ylistrum balloti TaxID=509963 RepID=UPI002905B00C|nr:uncharacterized protein LOC132549705 [Ylistrum balloti]
MSWAKLLFFLLAGFYAQLTAGVIPPDPECGVRKTCWPSECPTGGCDPFLISWWNTDLDYIRFEMRVEYVIQSEHYIALGFSEDNRMPDSSIVMCRSNANVELGYTQGRSYVSGTDVYGIRNATFSTADNVTTCSFDRIKIPIRNQNQLKYLTNPFFILRAWGSVTGNVPNYHGNANRGVSPNSFSYPVQVASAHRIKPLAATFCASLLVFLMFYNTKNDSGF